MFGEPFWFFTHYGEIERSLSSAMIACAMLGMGGSLSLADFARVFVVWKGFAVGMLLQIVLVPVPSIGSALVFVRQTRFFEMTEFEWFHWWPFDLLIGLICLNLVVATLRRIPACAARLWL